MQYLRVLPACDHSVMIDFGVGVILPAAGEGERFSSPIPKQYTLVMGKPLLCYSAEVFLKLAWVKLVVIVVDDVLKAKELIESAIGCQSKLLIVPGGTSRHRSIEAGLLELQKNTADFILETVIVHDAVRPLLQVKLLEELVTAARIHGAAGATRPLVSTVIKPDADKFLEESLDRSQYVASETPQAFQIPILSRAYKKCCAFELDNGTECLQLVLKHCGVKAKLVSGSDELWKVTYKKDLHCAERCLRENYLKVCLIMSEEIETKAVYLAHNKLKNFADVVDVSTSFKSSAYKVKQGFKYNVLILFHMQEIQQDEQLAEFSTLLNIEEEGIIIHVIDHSSGDGMQNMSVYELHRNGRKMAHQYKKLNKGVIVIHRVMSGESDMQLIDLITSVIQADFKTFSGQTLFL